MKKILLIVIMCNCISGCSLFSNEINPVYKDQLILEVNPELLEPVQSMVELEETEKN